MSTNARDSLAPFLAALAKAVVVELDGHRTGPRLKSLREAAEYLAMSEESLREKVSARMIPSVRGDRHIRFDVKDLDAWIEKHKAL